MPRPLPKSTFDPSGTPVKVGTPERGKALFAGKGACATCHRVNGSGPRTAPDLSDIGALRTAGALQRSLVDPTSAMIPINRPVRIVTKDGRTIRGRRLNEDTYTVQLIDDKEQLVSLIKADLNGKVLTFLGAMNTPQNRLAIKIHEVKYAMVCPTTDTP